MVATLCPSSQTYVVIASYGQVGQALAAPRAGVGVHGRDERVELGEALLEDRRALGDGRQPRGHALGDVLGPWQAPAISTPSTTVSTGRSLGWISL